MKKPSRFLRVLGAAGLLISLLAATIAPVSAQGDEDGSQDFLDHLIGVENAGFLTGNNSIYYPWVANDDDFGLGSADTSISVQNLEDRDTIISIFVGDGAGGFDLVTSAFLSAYAAKTFHASALGIAEGSGAPVVVTSFNEEDVSAFPDAIGVPEEAITTAPGNTVALVETPVILSNPVADDTDDDEDDGGDSTQVVVCVVNTFSAGQPGLGSAHGYVDAQTGEWVPYTTQQELQDTLNEVNDGNLGELINPFGGLNNDGDCFDVLNAEEDTLNDSVAIGGVAKQAVDGETLPATSEVDTAVSGYNAINGVEIDYFDEWYLPIVQTNCGPGGCWDSMLRIANYDSLNNAVTVRFFPDDQGSGSLQEGFQLQALVDGGDTWNINLGDYVPDEWIGTAHIFSDGAVFAMVDRYKVGYNMWITNTGSSADFENLAQVPGSNGRYVLFAPHVLMDYYGWNTGINVANLVNTDNNISIQYFNMLGNATEVLNQRLAAHGMTWFYDPSVGAQDNNSQDVTTDPNAGVVGSALIWSDFPVAAAIDATKYPETDPNGGADLFQATSYSATANVFPWQAVPLVQKGAAIDGMGDTSGINIMNPNNVAVTAEVYYVNPSGFGATNFGTSSVTIPAFANGFVYTLWQNNLPNGFLGAAQVVATAPVAAVSANVNYEVDGDGSAIFNAFNPCGFFRVAGACSFGDVFAPGGQSVTKTFVDENGDPVSGVGFSITSTSGAGYQRDATSGPDGSSIMTNVPVGTYDLEVNSVPLVEVDDETVSPFVFPEGVQETFVVSEGEDVVLENVLEFNQGFTKLVCIGEFDEEAFEEALEEWIDDGEDEDEEPNPNDFLTCSDIGLVGVQVTVYEIIGMETNLNPVVAIDPVFDGETGADGTVGAGLPPGDYILCIYKSRDTDPVGGFDSDITTTDGDEVDPDLIPFIANLNPCIGEDDDDDGDFELESDQGDLFEVVAGTVTELENEILINGVIDGFVGDLLEEVIVGASLAEHAEDMEPVAGVEVCIDDEDSLFDFDFSSQCQTSDANGNIQFEGAPEGWYEVESFSFPPGVFFECVEGSDSLEWSDNAIECDENGIPVSQLQGQGTGFSFYYDPLADLEQGDTMDDIENDGIYDATMQVDVEEEEPVDQDPG